MKTQPYSPLFTRSLREERAPSPAEVGTEERSLPLHPEVSDTVVPVRTKGDFEQPEEATPVLAFCACPECRFRLGR